MKSRKIYIKLQQLKEKRDDYTIDEYEAELLKLKTELVEGTRIDFESTVEETNQIKGILGIG